MSLEAEEEKRVLTGSSGWAPKMAHLEAHSALHTLVSQLHSGLTLREQQNAASEAPLSGAVRSPVCGFHLWFWDIVCVCAQSCLTLCDPMDCSLPGSSVHCGFPGKNTGVGCHLLLQGTFLTRGLNLHLLHLLHRQADFLSLHHLGSSFGTMLWDKLVAIQEI